MLKNLFAKGPFLSFKGPFDGASSSMLKVKGMKTEDDSELLLADIEPDSFSFSMGKMRILPPGKCHSSVVTAHFGLQIYYSFT